ncbi:MAG: hypothetical protein RSF39_02490 [Romboutsia sp.]
MINLWKKEDLNLLSEYPKEIVDNVDNVINILDESYGNSRKVTDNGGYVCLIEDIEEVGYFKENILKGIVEEFSDVIYESENVAYNSTLYLLSSDYSITVITNNESTDRLLNDN